MLVCNSLPISNTLVTCIYNPTNKCNNYTSGIQPIGVVTMDMQVLHNSCNMCAHNLPDVYALSPWDLAVNINNIPMIMSYY